MSELTHKKQIDKAEKISLDIVEENLDKGSQVLDFYKGITLFGISGDSNNAQSLSRGHFGSNAAGGIPALVAFQEQLNRVGSLDAELVPVMKKINSYPGKVWVEDKIEALMFGKKYNFDIVQKGKFNEKNEFEILESEKNKYYYDYQGFYQNSSIISQFAYNIARASGSFQGETKQVVGDAISNIKPVPVFPMPNSIRPVPEMYGSDPDAD